MKESYKFELNKEDMTKIAKGAAIAVAAAALTYAAEIIPSIDFGPWTPVVVSGTAILINAGRKFLAGY